MGFGESLGLVRPIVPAITTAEIGAQAVTYAKLDQTTVADLFMDKAYEFISETTFSAEGSKTVATITDTDWSKIHLDIRLTASGNSTVLIRLNNDSTAADYVGVQIINNAISGSSNNAMFTCPIGLTSSTKCHQVVEIDPSGSGASNAFWGYGQGRGTGTNVGGFLFGHKVTGVNVSTIQILPNGVVTFTGTVRAYGVRA